MSGFDLSAAAFDGPALSLFTALPIMGALIDDTGRVLVRTERLRRFLGGDVPSDQLAFAAIHPEFRARLEHNVASLLHSGSPSSLELQLRNAAGEYRWAVMDVEPLYASADGARYGAVTVTDVDERRRAETALRDQLAFNDRLLAASDDCIMTLDLDGNLRTINEVGRVALEIDVLDDHVGRRWSDLWPHAERGKAVGAVARAAHGEAVHYTAEYRGRSERRSWWEISISPIVDVTGRPERLLAISRDVSEQIETENARRMAIARLELLVTTGRVLASSLDYTTTLNNIARLAVETIADVCLFDIVGDDGEPALVAVAHTDPARESAMASAGRHLESEPGRPEHPVRATMRTGASTLVPLTDPAWIASESSTAAHARFMTEFEYRSLIVVPVPSGERMLGTLTLVLAGATGRLFTEADLTFAQELGRRAGVAVENARMYTRERHVATALQQASLPAHLPRLPHLRFDATYRAGKSEATIGGDWYDAFALRDGRIALTVGDVLGSGLKAAVVMTKLRQAMQSAALIAADPNAMLDAAQQTLQLHSADGIATAIAAILDPITLSISLASAGHPGPALRRADGRIEEIAVPGVLLGLRETADVLQRRTLAPGDTLVFYTDGLVETTRDLEEGIARLHAALALPEIYGADRPAQLIMDHVLPEGGATDDTAVLVISVS